LCENGCYSKENPDKTSTPKETPLQLQSVGTPTLVRTTDENIETCLITVRHGNNCDKSEILLELFGGCT